jgi:hypothetical protein
MSRTPSRRVLWTLVVTVAIVGGTIAASAVIDARDRREANNPSTPSMPIEITRDPSLASLEDGDRDALLDWEETLRGTNPANPDTDGDGTQDGTEVASGRDPKVAGPDDSIETVAANLDAKLSAEYEAAREQGTLTDQFAQSFAERYVELKADGGFTQEDQADLIGSLSSIAAGGGGAVSTTYRADLVPVLSDTSVESLTRYANAVSSAHVDGLVPIAQRMRGGEGSRAFGEGFQNLARTIASIQAPAEITGAQADLANAYETIGVTVAAMSAENDPLASLVSIPSLQKAEAQRAEASQKIARYLASRGVALQSGESATFWTRMIEG